MLFLKQSVIIRDIVLRIMEPSVGRKVFCINRPTAWLHDSFVVSIILFVVTSLMFSALGGSSLSKDRLQDCITRSHVHAKEVHKLIEETINAVDR